MQSSSRMYALIDRLCRERGTNVTVMCKDLNITRSVLSELKSGRTRQLSSDYTARIAAYFGVTVEYLLGQPDISAYADPPEEIPDEFRVLARKTGRLPREQQKQIYRMLDQTVDQVLSILRTEEKEKDE